MSGSLLESIPPEVLFSISDQVDLDDRKNLSLVNSGLRSAIVPYLFKVLRVNCPVIEDNIIPTIVDKYGAYVLELRLNVTFYPNEIEEQDATEDDVEEEEEDESNEGDDGDGDKASDMNVSKSGQENDDESKHNSEAEAETSENENEESGESDSESDSSRAWYWTNPPTSVWARKEADISIVHDLIRLTALPRCKTLTLYTNGEEDFEVEADWDDNDIGNNSIYFCCEPEDWDEVQTKEKRYPWRAALRDMYHDIATLSPVDDLKLLNFLPRKTSFWQKHEWAVYLGRLKKLTLHTYGADNGAGWSANTLPGFNGFFNDLPDTMLVHANNLEYLEIKADEFGFLGGSGSLFLAPNSLPALRVLHVHGIAVTSVLTDFLQEVYGKLSEIHITACVALDLDTNGAQQPRWAELWKAVRQAIKAPAEITCIPIKDQPITEAEDYHYGDDPYIPPDDEEEKIKRFRKRVKEEEDFCLWPYACQDEKYGSIYADYERNLERLETEEDNLEFKLLAEEVRRGGGSCNVS
ncbi:hypothetical protein FSPOR_4485 [Fusarium sporotrichioides]|uniref:F-box domain-containing protein n=1 Tax=Fusarium sporotrichioides TaxID=5514 RepID=A0A395SB94_FUSSP|nr:hypothetical protein FSPOR_4485 [Fusarium sporotrichioides]